MRLKTIYAMVALGLMSGCATQKEPLSWEIRPVLDVRHGMADANAYYQLGRYYQGQRRTDAAEKAFEQAVAADGHHVDALNALASLYAERGDLPRALATFKRVEALVPDQAYLHNNLGYALFLQGKYQDAILEMRHALSLNASYERAWLNLEQIARASGNTLLAEQARTRHLDAQLADAGEAPAGGAARVAEAPLAVASTLSLPATGPAGHDDVAVVQVVGDAPRFDALPLSQMQPGIASARPQPVAAPSQPLVAVTLRSIGTPGAGQLEGMRTITLQPPQPATAATPEPVGATLAPFRLEISNGNGIRHFASQFSAMLKRLGQPVARITNYPSFTMHDTVIEYRAGFADEADALNARLRLGATLQKLDEDRPGTDVRVILGHDLPKLHAETV